MGLGSGIRKKPIPDPGSRGQKSTDQIPVPDPQHWPKGYKTSVKMNSVNSVSGLLQPEDPAGQHQAGGAEAEAGGEEPGGRQERPLWQAGSPGGIKGNVRRSQRQEHAVPSRSQGCTGQVSQ
jgi:hypothetical protein